MFSFTALRKEFLRGRWLLGMTALLLAACASAPPPKPTYPELTFAHLQPIRLAVGEVRVQDAYVPPLKAPNVEHLFPIAPAAAVRRWIKDRLVATGGAGVATFTILDASVVEQALERKKGLKSVFTIEQSERYDGKIVVEMTIEDPRGAAGKVNAQVEHSRSVPEDISLNDREKVYFEMTERMMKELDVQLEKNIRAHLTDWLR